MIPNSEFFSAVLSAEGLPCLATLTAKGERKFFANAVQKNIPSMCDTLSRFDFTAHDTYFCISTLEKEVVEDSAGKRRVRVQPNCLHTKVFVLDIDVKDSDTYYKSKAEGLQGVKRIMEALKLPKPIIVDSGFGLHVYWPMASGIPSADWVKVARKFRDILALIEPKAVADASRVCDPAGVLRVPNSFNLKKENTPVKLVAWFDEYLDLDKFKQAVRYSDAEAAQQQQVLNIKATDFPSEPKDLREVAKKCNWVSEYIRTKNEASEPEWYAMLGLTPYMYLGNKTGETLAHALSSGHPDYSPEATGAKYEQAAGAQTGPTLCARFKSIKGAPCATCVFAGVVKTPISVAELDKPVEEQQEVEVVVQDEEGNKAVEKVVIPVPPKPYFRGENGGVYARIKEKQEDGSFAEKIIRIYDYDFYPLKRYRAETLETEHMELHLWLPKDGLKKFRLPMELLADGKGLNKFLSSRGAVAEMGNGLAVIKYLTAYVRHLQKVEAAEVEFSRFGWRDIFSAEPKFVLDGGFMTKAGEVEKSTIAPFLKDASSSVSTKGALDKWKQGFNVYTSIPNSEPYQLAALIGFAAPLMALTEYNGVLYNMVGHSAAGKSTALKVMSSVWGEPKETHILPKDTEIAMFNFIGYLNSVPVAFDELTKMDSDKLSDFCLNFTSGRGKMRARRDGSNMDNSVHWDTIVCSTSNTSLYDKLADARRGYNAEAMRIFELPVNESDPQFKHHVDNSIALLRDNYGVAGREYLRYIMPRLAGLKETVRQAMDAIVKAGNLRNEERFWGALLACTLVGAEVAKNALNLHNYDTKKVVKWALGLSGEVRDNVNATMSDSVSALSDFFNTSLGSILHISDGKAHLLALQDNMRDIRVRLEYEDDKPKWAHISVPAIRKYCKYNNTDPSWLRRELLNIGALTESNKQMRLTKGTKLPSINVKVWTIDMQHDKFVDAIKPLDGGDEVGQ